MLDATDHPNACEGTRDDAERVALIERSLLVLLVIGLFVGVIAILKPFTTAILFGASLATAAWPLRQALVLRGLRCGTAATLLLLFSLLIVGVPVLALAPTVAEQVSDVMQRVKSYFAASPAQPEWLAGIPLVGARVGLGWDRLVESGGNLRAVLAPYGTSMQRLIVAAASSLADSVLQVVLAISVATMFWARGDSVVAVLRETLRRLGGVTAEQTLDVAASAIRGVAYGVVGTAAVQGLLLAIGLTVAGVPGSAMLGFISFLFAITQIGAPFLIVIWGGAAWWLFGHEHQAWAWFIVVWGLFVSSVDNLIKPWLIGFSVQMPLSLTILGVFGGFVSFGFLGLFIGPTLLAVFFSLLQTWRTAARSAIVSGP